jgi:uncharacterized protein (TIGR02058 family)
MDAGGAPSGVFPAFLEMGLGVDLHGEDQTKAARRAVREAIGRTSLPGMRALAPGRDLDAMRVEATVAVPRPEEVDAAAVAAEFPYGRISVRAVAGGLRAPNGNLAGDGQDHLVCAVALVAVGW